MSDVLRDALADVPAGPWVVGVSGGADSVAVLCALRAYRPDVVPIVAHLDHESRGAASTADAAFVRSLAGALGVDAHICSLSQLGVAPPTANVEATYRAARLTLFARVASDRGAAGVVVAHHADDRAETTLLRLLRGGEATALAGLRRQANVNGLRIMRPMLSLRRATLEVFLASIGQTWRVDESNATDVFARNRVRQFLAGRPELFDPLVRLADAADAFRLWTDEHRPQLADRFAIAALADLPDPLARAAGRRWLCEHGAPPNDVSIDVVARLIAMCRDATMPARQAFPGNIVVRRQRGSLERTPHGLPSP